MAWNLVPSSSMTSFLLLDRHLELDDLGAVLGGLLVGMHEGRRDELDLLAGKLVDGRRPRPGAAATRAATAAAAMMARRVNIALSEVCMSLFAG